MRLLTRLGPIALGGALGALLRYWLEIHLGTSLRFPMGIFVANIGGAYVIGITLTLLPLVSLRSGPFLRLFIATGFCGGLTTLSTLAVAIAEEISHLGFLSAILYAIITITAGVAAAIIGRVTGRLWYRRGGLTTN
ncbi:CrcB family protein [Ferrimicrobium sp.]|uniref:fluoride efflux transporter FluC n=1 Tax=Ferrimicrobium sp. TaxID=2926050 RepID=UPI0026131ADA|nr:CrcB family protein [Ferrimicrobium sp.]